jgi:hypothetical protein
MSLPRVLSDGIRVPVPFVALLLLALVGCARAVPGGLDEPPGSSPSEEPLEEPSVDMSLIPSLPLPSGMVLPPIVDPDGGGPPYARGQAVRVDGLVVVYLGTERTEDGYVASFEVTGELPSSVSGMFFLPAGPSVPLGADGGTVTSEPFNLRGIPDPSTLIAWRIGSQTLIWELGPVGSS